MLDWYLLKEAFILIDVISFLYTSTMLTLQQPSSIWREIDWFSDINYRCQLRLPFQQSTFQLFFACTLDPLRTPAAPPQLIDNLSWWVETPCHQLLSQWKSIKNNTHLYPWAQSPFVFPVYQWRVLFYQNAFKQRKEKVKRVERQKQRVSAGESSVHWWQNLSVPTYLT